MIPKKTFILFLLISLSILFPALPGMPDEQRTKTEVKTIDIKLHDLELIDQDGKKLKFKSDLIGARVVALVPFYTTCTTSYPILIFVFSRLQTLLGERLNKDVILLSVSVDPRTDIPIRLKAFAQKQKARSGWVFLSGERTNLTTVLNGMGILTSLNLDDHNHTPLTVVGHAGGEWKRFYGYPSPDLLMSQIDGALAARAK